MLDVRVTFHTPFRVSSGTSSPDVDDVVLANRIPASSLKGVMRAAGKLRLELPDRTLSRIFGSVESDCPWAWSDLNLTDDDRTIRVRVQVPIDRDSGVARRGALLKAEEVWVDQPLSFAIVRSGMRDDDTQQDAILLSACCRAVHSLGASRRRGLGWVSLEPKVDGRPVTPEDAARAVLAARKRDQ